MKTIYSLSLFLLIAQLAFSNALLCPDAPINDDPCITSDNPPFDLTEVGQHTGTTCCARGHFDLNPDGSQADYENINCSTAVNDVSVWYMYTPDPQDDGYNILLEPGDAEGPTTLEVYSGVAEAGCIGTLNVIASSCNSNSADIKFGNCFDENEVIFIKVSTALEDENCGSFTINMLPAGCDFMADECIDLQLQAPIAPITNQEFVLDYVCVPGCLEFACPETNNNGGCIASLEMPTVWFQITADDMASQMFTTVTSNGNWDPIWSVYSGPDCDNLSVIVGSSPPCSNGDNTPELHHNLLIENEFTYWVSVTVDPSSVPASGIDDGSFELCVATAISTIICIGEEDGDCNDESLVIEIVERDNDHLPLDGPFCPGEEVKINIGFYYDTSESGNEWFIGFVPDFGSGWDVSNFDFSSSPPQANGSTGEWFEEGSALAPLIKENVSTLCTFINDDGRLQLCNLLCEPCMECPQQGMMEDDPLPSGYFWVSTAGGPDCENDGSPGEGWGLPSGTQVQIDWSFTLKVKEFEDLENCMDKNDLQIAFQTFSDGVAGCWDDAFECLTDRSMIGPAWTIGCTELPPEVLAQSIEICTKQDAIIAVNTIDGSQNTIVVKAVDNLYVTGANDYTFQNGTGVISDFLINNSDQDRIVEYEIYAINPDLECNGPKKVIEVLVRTQVIANLEDVVCLCANGCSNIGVTPEVGSTYNWSTGANTSMINVCPAVPTLYTLTVTDLFGCEHYGDVFVDCEGMSEECEEVEYYKLLTDFFIDNNENGIRDPEDFSFDQGSFFLQPNLALYYNTSEGEDELLLEEGDYTLTFIQGNLNNYSLTTDSIVDVTLDAVNNCVKVEFGLTPDLPLRNVQIYYNLNHRCNTDQTFILYAKNYGTNTESGILWATLDEIILADDFPASALIDTFIAPNTVGWFFENLFPGNSISKSLEVHIPGPPDVPVGWVLNHKIFIELNNNDGTSEIWKEEDISRSILCGYDPNDKAVEPIHEEGYTNIEEDELVFKIRFQNTGNAPAVDIEIRDTLSQFLDVNTVQYIAGSHDDFLTFSRVDERVLLFNFDNINLPDSIVDPEGSQGFLIYSVSVNEGVEEGTLIENTAHIYFDNNPPVVTNTTKNLFYSDLDNDGFFSIEDCDDTNAEINPDAEEVVNNDVDEDCDGVALMIDEDMDGFNSDEDCDDTNAEINPDAEEIANNDVDENCDGEVLVIDEDMDGFNSDEDCDDSNAEINPDAEEIANNDVDENCDGEVLVIDEDMDGFNSDEDCDDTNAEINPDAEEIANNDVDENCDGEVLVIDEDMDGFNSDEDCDDMNPDINPDAEDIPENGIDEDCDGEDAVIISLDEEQLLSVSINPNPSNDAFNIILNLSEELNYVIRDLVGKEIERGKISASNKTVYLGDQPNGVYLIVLSNSNFKHSTYHKLLKI